MQSKLLHKKFRFREFQVYKDARKFSKEVKTVIRQKFPLDEQFSLTQQLWRALDSIALNIAEGSDWGSDKDFARFLNTAQTSLNEVVACLDLALDSGYIDKEHPDFVLKASLLVDQLTAFRRTLLTQSKTTKPFWTRQALGVRRSS